MGKLCRKCGEDKPILEYGVCGIAKDGLQFWCRNCLSLERDNKDYKISVNQKTCSRCMVLKDASEFRVHKLNKTGLKSLCRKCERDITKQYLSTERGKAYQERIRYGSQRYSAAKSHAKRRGIEWNITRDEFNDLKDKPCYYCGDYARTTGSGLDRINTLKGYIIDNVVPCCKICNIMKWDYWTSEEMLKIGKIVKELKLARRVRF